MIYFDEEHKKIKGSLKKSKEKLKVKDIVIAGMLITSVFLFSGCAKNVECHIEETHAHKYVSEQQLDKYVISEKEHIGSWGRLDDYILIDKKDEKLMDFINDNDLYIIQNNIDEIRQMASEKHDQTEYRYSYKQTILIPQIRKVGKVTTVTQMPYVVTNYSWTTDANHPNLTGEQREVHHMYQGYKIEVNEKGEYEIIASSFVENIEDLLPEYPYVSSDFIKTVNANNYNIEVDYEDGPEQEAIELSAKEAKEFEETQGISKSR